MKETDYRYIMENMSVLQIGAKYSYRELVDDIDPDAFVIVSDAREVHGEGFIEKN